MKKILVDGYFVGNVGDDLFLKILIERFPDVSFTTHVDEKYLSIYENFQNLTIIPKNISYKITNYCLSARNSPYFTRKVIAGFDGYIEIGGSIFQQISDEEQVSFKRKNMLESGIPYYIIGSNFGPVLNEKFTNAYNEFFAKVQGVTFRDSASYALFANLKSTNFFPDVVFNLNSQKIKTHHENKPYITLVPINLTNREFSEEVRLNYERKMVELGQYFIEKGYLVKILVFNEYEGDRLVAKRIADLFDKKSVEIVNYTNLTELLSIIKGSKNLISSRFHAMILGWVFRIPQIVLKYSGKIDAEIQDVFPNQTNFTLNSFGRLSINELISNMNTISELDLEKTKNKASGQFEKISLFLE